MILIYCGTGKETITPNLGTPLAGYGGNQRNSTGIHDQLYARVIAVKNNDDYFIIVSLDLVGVDRVYTERLTSKIREQFNIPPQNVFVHATHTHSASGGIFDDNSLISKAYPYMNGYLSYKNSIIKNQHEQICKSIESALCSLEPCEVLFGEGVVEGIATNRNSPENPFDSKLKVVEFRYLSGDRTVLYHFSSHPTIMHASNLSISADFPGVTSEVLENKQDIRLALFLNGPSADISTRFTRLESSFNEVERLGKKLSEGVLQVLNKMKIIKDKPLLTKVSNIQVSTREVPNIIFLKNKLDELKERYKRMKSGGEASDAELRRLRSKIEGVSTSIDIGDKLHGLDKVDTILQMLRIGKLTLLSIPGEIYFETGQEIINKFSNPTLVVGNTNDHLGYIVPAHYYEEGNYESFMTLLKKGSAEQIKTEAIKDLKECSNQKTIK